MITTNGNDLVVIASNATELAEGQSATIEMVKSKEILALSELAEAKELLAQAKKSKFSPKAAIRLEKKAESRVLYLGKIREALEAGFVIVPNFPGPSIAVRVQREKPKARVTNELNYLPTVPDVVAEALPVGEGRYVDVRPFTEHDSRVVTEKNYNGDLKEVNKYQAWPSAYDENLELPIEFLKPVVIERTTKAMAHKIFDEIAITQDASWPRRADPMVVGRIRDPRSKRFLSFLIAWFIDTKEI